MTRAGIQAMDDKLLNKIRPPIHRSSPFTSQADVRHSPRPHEPHHDPDLGLRGTLLPRKPRSVTNEARKPLTASASNRQPPHLPVTPQASSANRKWLG